MELRFLSVLSMRSAAPVTLAILAGRALAQDSYLLGPAPLGGDVQRFEVSPDGHWAVYVDGFVHSVKVTGGEKPRRLDPRPERGLGALGTTTVTISPDSRRVVYGAVDGTGHTTLASAPIDGSSGPVDLLPDAGACLITPDSRTAVVIRRVGGGDLYSVPIDGSGPATQLNDPSPTERVVNQADFFGFAQEGRLVVYATEGYRLWAVPVDGSASPMRIDGPMGRGGGSLRFTPFGFSFDTQGFIDGGILFRVAAGGKRVLYLADQRTKDAVELFGAVLPAAPSPPRSTRGK